MANSISVADADIEMIDVGFLSTVTLAPLVPVTVTGKLPVAAPEEAAALPPDAEPPQPARTSSSARRAATGASARSRGREMVPFKDASAREAAPAAHGR